MAIEQMEERPGKVGILVVDMIPLLCEGLARLFNAQRDLACCGMATRPEEAISLVHSSKPACAVVPLGMKEIFGLQLIRELKLQRPSMRILVFSLHEEEVFAERALHAGAHGYLSKFSSSHEILHAVRQILSGEVYLSPAMTAKFLHRFTGHRNDEVVDSMAQLSDRELQVFELVGRGMGPQEISERLHLGIKTVESYKTRIKDKLGLANARQLLQQAFEWVRTSR